jgi:hypothetical protein
MTSQGDRVRIVIGGESAHGAVLLASNNGRSLMLEFDAILKGHVGMMPVLLGPDGHFRSIVTNEIVEITHVEGRGL